MQNTNLWFRAEQRSCHVPVLPASLDLGWFLPFLTALWMSITGTCYGPKFFQILAKCVDFYASFDRIHLNSSFQRESMKSQTCCCQQEFCDRFQWNKDFILLFSLFSIFFLLWVEWYKDCFFLNPLAYAVIWKHTWKRSVSCFICKMTAKNPGMI